MVRERRIIERDTCKERTTSKFQRSLSLDRYHEAERKKERKNGEEEEKRSENVDGNYSRINRVRCVGNNSCRCPDPDKYEATSGENHAGGECISEGKSGETRGKAMYRVIFSPIVSKESVIASKHCVSMFHFYNSFHRCRSHNHR